VNNLQRIEGLRSFTLATIGGERELLQILNMLENHRFLHKLKLCQWPNNITVNTAAAIQRLVTNNSILRQFVWEPQFYNQQSSALSKKIVSFARAEKATLAESFIEEAVGMED